MSFDDSQLLQGWRIEDLTLLNSSQTFYFRSQTFKVNYLNNSKWHLELHHGSHDSVGIHLFKDYDGSVQFPEITISLFLLTQKGWIPLVKKEKRLCVGKAIGLYILNNVSIDNYSWLPNGLVSISLTMHKLKKKVICSQCFMRSKMVDGKLVHSLIQECQYLKQSDFVNFSDPAELVFQETKTTSSCPKTENTLSCTEDLIHYFKEKKFQFVTLRTAEKEFAVHKALLCAKSPVFNAMFEKEMRESGSHVVEIEDIDASTLSLFLNFLHLEPLKDLEWDQALKLYYAADKYQVLRLRDICASFLKKNMSKKNVCEAIVLADLHQDKELKYSAQKYFCENSKSVLRSPEWKDLMIKNTELALETLQALADKL